MLLDAIFSPLSAAFVKPATSSSYDKSQVPQSVSEVVQVFEKQLSSVLQEFTSHLLKPQAFVLQLSVVAHVLARLHVFSASHWLTWQWFSDAHCSLFS
jgi:hypothetical protein